jgi:hypothetical protein
MGAAYGGAGQPLAYQESAEFNISSNGGGFFVDLLGDDSIGTGLDTAMFDVSVNGAVVYSQTMTDLSAFFSHDLFEVPLRAGLNDVQLEFAETMGAREGFLFDYALGTAPAAAAAPDLPTWAMILIGFAGLGFVGYRRSQRGSSAGADLAR